MDLLRILKPQDPENIHTGSDVVVVVVVVVVYLGGDPSEGS